jgi:NADH-quinone oxidoreductase subunit N
MKAVVCVGLAGTLLLGIYPQPFIDWAVAATLMFSNLAGSAAVVSPSLPFGG